MAAHLAARQHAPGQNGDGHAPGLLHANGHGGSGNGHGGSGQGQGAHTGSSGLNGWEK